jgi:hypothetical protein
MNKLSTITIFLLLLASSCTHRILVTFTQPHTVSKVDTVGDHVKYKLVPISKPRSSIGNGIQPGDTVKVLHDYFIRY